MQRMPENDDKGNAAQSPTSLNLVSIRLNLDSSILRLPYRLFPKPESQICGHCGFDRRRIFEVIEETAVPRYIIRGNALPSAPGSRSRIPAESQGDFRWIAASVWTQARRVVRKLRLETQSTEPNKLRERVRLTAEPNKLRERKWSVILQPSPADGRGAHGQKLNRNLCSRAKYVCICQCECVFYHY